MSDVKNLEDMQEILVTSKVLEELFGVGARMVRKLENQGIINKNSHGKYLLIESVKNYILTLKLSRSKAALQSETDGEILDYDSEHAKHEFLKRQITEIKLQLIRGQVHKAEDVEAVMMNMFENFKSKINGMPPKLARELEGKDRFEIQKKLKAETDAALMELSEYSPEKFYSDEHIEADTGTLDILEDENGC